MTCNRRAVRLYYRALGLALAFLGQALFGPSLFSFLLEAFGSQLMGVPLFLMYCYLSVFPYAAEFGVFSIIAAPMIYGATAFIVGKMFCRWFPWSKI